MKFAVYGDSFGAGNPDLIEKWWPTILSKYLKASEYKNFSEPGSPFFISYKKFLQNYENFDINLVIVTEPTRYTMSFVTENFDYGYVPGLGNLEELKYSSCLAHKDDYTYVSYLEGWFRSLDIEFMETAQELMLQDMEKRCDHLFLIPSFTSSFTDYRRQQMKIGNNHLSAFNKIQMDSLGVDQNGSWRENGDTINCHFTDEVNDLVALTIYSQVKFNQRKWQYPKVVRHRMPREYYYIKEEK